MVSADKNICFHGHGSCLRQACMMSADRRMCFYNNGNVQYKHVHAKEQYYNRSTQAQWWTGTENWGSILETRRYRAQ